MSNSSTHLLFAQCAPGLEDLLSEELRGLGTQPRKLEGGVEWRGDEESLWKVCLGSRLTESVRLRLKSFVVKDFASLEKAMRKLPFRAYLPAGSGFRVQVVCHKSRLWHSGAVQERVEGVLKNHVGWVPSEDEAAQLVHVRMSEDEAQISLDAGGSRMHRRGYRPHVEKASLRETLAAALLFQAQTEAPSAQAPVIWDPFCGAGTILLEALDGSESAWAGRRRIRAFEGWRAHRAEAFQSFVEKGAEQGAFWPDLRCLGSDTSQRAVAAAENNAKEGGWSERVALFTSEVKDATEKIPEGAIVITNPPYGKRLAEVTGVRDLMTVLKQRPDLRPALALLGGAGRDLVPKECPALFRTKNGGLSVSARRLDRA